jgi:hypothetical protein
MYRLAIAASIAAACSNSSSRTGTSTSGPKASAGDSGQASGAGDCKRYVACNLLTAAEINGALGAGLSVSAGVEIDSIDIRPSFECGYSPGMETSFAFSVTCDPEAPNNADAYAAFNRVFAGTPLSGLGQAAFWRDMSATTGGSDLQVFFGKDGMFGFTLILPASATVDRQAAATSLAKVVLSRL